MQTNRYRRAPHVAAGGAVPAEARAGKYWSLIGCCDYNTALWLVVGGNSTDVWLVQEMVERILYIWAIRHPASGYVQGINDLVTPFLMVFLQVS